jgi:hypothetical protein
MSEPPPPGEEKEEPPAPGLEEAAAPAAAAAPASEPGAAYSSHDAYAAGYAGAGAGYADYYNYYYAGYPGERGGGLPAGEPGCIAQRARPARAPPGPGPPSETASVLQGFPDEAPCCLAAHLSPRGRPSARDARMPTPHTSAIPPRRHSACANHSLA